MKTKKNNGGIILLRAAFAVYVIRTGKRRKIKAPGPTDTCTSLPSSTGESTGEKGRLTMPVTVRLSHAVADGFPVANVFRLTGKETALFTSEIPAKED